MIEVKNLTKLYGKFKAVDDVSLCAADGEVTILQVKRQLSRA